MQEKFLKSLVEELAYSEAMPIVDLLFNKKDVNEFFLAKKMKLTINQVRNILYKLSAEGLVSFIRKKDNRKGWYIYFWTLNTEKCLLRLEQELTKKIKELEEVLRNREQKRFYFCNSCGIEVTEETALENDFSCQECAEVYTLSNNEKPIKELMNKIKIKDRELKTIQAEINEIKQNQAKKKHLDNKKIKKKKTSKKKAKTRKKAVKKKTKR